MQVTKLSRPKKTNSEQNKTAKKMMKLQSVQLGAKLANLHFSR